MKNLAFHLLKKDGQTDKKKRKKKEKKKKNEKKKEKKKKKEKRKEEVKNGELKLPLTIIKKSIVVLISDPHNGTIFSNISRKFYHRKL